MIVVDSSVWIEYFLRAAPTPPTEVLDQLLSRRLIVIGDLILVEVLQGFRSDRDFRTAWALLESLEYRGMTSRELALRSARNFRELRKKRVVVRKTIAVMIATFCIENDLPLLHDDRDFDVFAELGPRSLL